MKFDIPANNFQPFTITVETADEASILMGLSGRLSGFDIAKFCAFDYDTNQKRAEKLMETNLSLYRTCKKALNKE